MKNKSTLITIIAVVVIMAGVTVWGLSQDDSTTGNKTDSSEAEMSISPSSYDFKDVSQKEGVVSTSFIIENTGTSDLIIDDMLSSCGCTTATLTVDGQEGPRFGMHNNPRNWSETIAPGGEAELIVYYDPNVHQDFRGKATREITLFSNDKNNSEKRVKISINQVD